MNPAVDAVIGIYRRHGAARAQARGTGLPARHWPDRFRALIPRAGTVLDLGCGTGTPIARYRAGRGHQASLAVADHRAPFDAAGFTIVAHVVDDPACRRTVWLARRRPD